MVSSDEEKLLNILPLNTRRIYYDVSINCVRGVNHVKMEIQIMQCCVLNFANVIPN